VPQEVHRSAKRLSRFPFSDRLKKPFLFLFTEEAGAYVTTTARSRKDETADEL
jgi:hypothetical protein